MLVCLESLQRLGASDLQTDSGAWFDCLAVLRLPCVTSFFIELNCPGSEADSNFANLEAGAFPETEGLTHFPCQ